jgi:hypothetical protein
MAKKKQRTPEEIAERNEKWYAHMRELKAQGKLSKAGEWILSEEGQAGLWEIADMKAIMK